MRTYFGRPRSSMRFRTWAATSISVARRSSVCERSSSPITRLNRPMVASARARQLYPDAFCHPMRPFSAMSWRWRSRCVGAVSAVALGTAVERGGTMPGRRGMALADAGVDAVLVVRAVACDGGHCACDLVEQGANQRAIIDIVGRQLRRNDPARVSIDAEVHLAPGPAPSRAMLLDQPLAGPTQRQARAVHQQVHGLGAAARPWAGHLHGLVPAAQGGVVRH